MCFVLILALLPIEVPNDAGPTAVLREDKPAKVWRARFLTEQAKALKSDEVLKAALARPAISNLKVIKDKADAKTWLRDGLIVGENVKLAELRVSFSEGTEKERAVLVNAVVDAYLTLRETRDRKERERLDQEKQDLVEMDKAVAARFSIIDYSAPTRELEERVARAHLMVMQNLATMWKHDEAAYRSRPRLVLHIKALGAR